MFLRLAAVVAAATAVWQFGPDPSPAGQVGSLPAPADGAYVPSAADVDAAVAVVARDDDGAWNGPVRWDRPAVTVAVTGPAATEVTAARIDGVLAWLTTATGVHFHRTGTPADVTVVLAAGVSPRARVWHRAGVAAHAEATWDPTHYGAGRWMWEELLHTAGPIGDHGPPGSVLSTDRAPTVPSAFDAWVLRTLYRPEVLPRDEGGLRRLYDRPPAGRRCCFALDADHDRSRP